MWIMEIYRTLNELCYDSADVTTEQLLFIVLWIYEACLALFYIEIGPARVRVSKKIQKATARQHWHHFEFRFCKGQWKSIKEINYFSIIIIIFNLFSIWSYKLGVEGVKHKRLSANLLNERHNIQWIYSLIEQFTSRKKRKKWWRLRLTSTDDDADEHWDEREWWWCHGNSRHSSYV